jgi:hypothetical protein
VRLFKNLLPLSFGLALKNFEFQKCQAAFNIALYVFLFGMLTGAGYL